jgi:hypothetical protein
MMVGSKMVMLWRWKQLVVGLFGVLPWLDLADLCKYTKNGKK